MRCRVRCRGGLFGQLRNRNQAEPQPVVVLFQQASALPQILVGLQKLQVELLQLGSNQTRPNAPFFVRRPDVGQPRRIQRIAAIHTLDLVVQSRVLLLQQPQLGEVLGSQHVLLRRPALAGLPLRCREFLHLNQVSLLVLQLLPQLPVLALRVGLALRKRFILLEQVLDLPAGGFMRQVRCLPEMVDLQLKRLHALLGGILLAAQLLRVRGVAVRLNVHQRQFLLQLFHLRVVLSLRRLVVTLQLLQLCPERRELSITVVMRTGFGPFVPCLQLG